MDKESLDRNIKEFVVFLNKFTLIQFWTGLIFGGCVILVGLFFHNSEYITLIWGLGIAAFLLLVESLYYLSNPYKISCKNNLCIKDLTDLRSDMEDKLKVFGLILIIGILFSISSLFVPLLKFSIPLCIPVVILGAIQMVKTQLILFRCNVLEDEINRSEVNNN